MLEVSSLPPISFLFNLFFLVSCSPLSVLPNNILQIFVCPLLRIMNNTFLSLHLYHLLWWLLSLFSSNLWSMWELSNSKNWKRYTHIYLIFGNKRRHFLKVIESRKRIVDILKSEKSFRMEEHFLEIIKKVSFVFNLNTICALFRLLPTSEKLNQKSTWTQQNDFCQIKSASKFANKLSSKWTWNQ